MPDIIRINNEVSNSLIKMVKRAKKEHNIRMSYGAAIEKALRDSGNWNPKFKVKKERRIIK